jgi:hypothetical protein
MTETTFTARCGDESWPIKLNPKGTVLGRGATCDVVIDRMEISRRHVRASCNSSGQWVFEDLGSSNGLFVNGIRVEACTIYPGDVVMIGSVSLSLGETPRQPAGPTVTSQVPHVVVQDFGMEVFYDKPRLDDCATAPRPGRIKQMHERLSQQVGLPALYTEACNILAEGPKTVAAVFRMSRRKETPSKMPEVLAYHFADDPGGTRARRGSEGDSPWRALRVSHRLLEAVRTGEKPLMTKTVFSCDTKVTISLIDEHNPRALMCVPLRGVEHVADLLYFDFPIEERTGLSPEEIFAFVQAVAKQIECRST